MHTSMHGMNVRWHRDIVHMVHACRRQATHTEAEGEEGESDWTQAETVQKAGMRR